MSRVITAGELALLRTRPQRTQLYLVIPRFASLFDTTLASLPSSDDRCTSIAYSGSAPATILPDMEIRVSSSGGADKGRTRVRTAPSAGTVGIGETSEIDWSNGDVLSFYPNFALWPRHYRIDAATSVVYVDESAYTNQHATFDPVPCMGSHVVVPEADLPATVYYTASGSWAPDSSISTYLWTVAPSTGVTITGGTTSTPSVRFANPGTYRVACTLTSAAGKSFTGYRYAFCLGTNYEPVTDFVLDSCEGNFDSGGWSFSVTAYENVTTTDLRDRDLVLLCARDWYGGTEGEIGAYTGNYANYRNNIVTWGWVSDESITRNPNLDSVSFTVEGPHAWLDRITGFPLGIFDTDFTGLPADTNGWNKMANLTVDKALWHWARWRTTLTRITDVLVTGDTLELPVAQSAIGKLWSQVKDLCNNTILALPCFDRFGRLHIKPDQQLVAPAARSFPVSMQLTDPDWRDTVTIQRRVYDEVAQIDISGVSYNAGTAAALFGLGSGHIPHLHGRVETIENLLLADQAGANTFAGALMGKFNNRYPIITLPLSSNNRVVDIAPRQFVSMALAAGDTERGLVWPDAYDTSYSRTAKYLVPRVVSHTWNAGAGLLLTDLECEAEAFPGVGVAGDPPPEPPDPGPAPDPPEPPEPPEETNHGVIVATRTQVAVTPNFDDATPTWTAKTPGGSDKICGFALGTDGKEGWLVTRASGAVSGDFDNGIWHCSNVFDPTDVWSLVYSQAAGYTDGRAAKSAVGWARLDYGEIRSIVSIGLGAAVAIEGCDHGLWDRDPSAAFVTANYGATWTATAVTTPANGRFWANQYFELGCYQLDFDGSNVHCLGLRKKTTDGGFTSRGGLATSADGVNWTLTDGGTTVGDYRSCNVVGGTYYGRVESGASSVYEFPITPYVNEGPYSNYARRTQYDGALVEIVNHVTDYDTHNYIYRAGAEVVDSADVGWRIGACRNFDSATLYLVFKSATADVGSVVGVWDTATSTFTDKTSNLISALGGTWDGVTSAVYDCNTIEWGDV